jgi:nitrogen fixation/metabolism regulation signal transduction histidine kinase
MKFEQYDFQVGLRLVILFAAMLGLAFVIAYDREFSLALLLGSIVIFVSISFVRYTNSIVRDLGRFFGGMRYGDFQQTISIRRLGARFQELESGLNQTINRLKDIHTEQQQQSIYFQSLLQHLPLPFLILHDDGRIQIMNMATRRAFNVAEITMLDDLKAFGATFQRDVLQIQPGESLLSNIMVDSTDEYYILTATEITMDGRSQKLVALLNVQEELDATELATWQNLLRVTSHEILNSLAPVSSCAQTAESLIGDILAAESANPEIRSDLEDIRDAIDTMARRSEGLMRFVRSYRQLTRMPPPKTQNIVLGDYFHRLESLLISELTKNGISIRFETQPAGLTLLADEDMLDQAMINLVRNAADALNDSAERRIDVRAYIDNKQRIIIEVEDNGPGIDPQTAKNIFVPFFTTKQKGSGVGLALVRYIMLTHGGTALHSPARNQGSIFKLVF